MTPDAIRAIVFEEIQSVAPDADPATVPGDADFREELDLDSMDFLNIVEALHTRLGADIPEADYARVATLDGLVDYLVVRVPA
jgi:acyl carrier protein